MARDPLSDLDRAFELVARWRSSEARTAVADFLSEHAELRELLEPLVREADGGDQAEELRSLGDFRLLCEIGRGGMGIVYEAEQISLDRRVALKILPPHLGLPAHTVARFRREALVSGRLRHAGLVEVYDFGSEGDLHYFAMELVRGAPLDAVLDELRAPTDQVLDGAAIGAAVLAHRIQASNDPSPRGVPELAACWRFGATQVVCSLVVQIADALHHAHEAGILHRDVKPSNVLVRPDGGVVLTDFGLSADQALPDLSLDGSMIGTPGYMSPEQIDGLRGAMDRRTDVFSLGVTLYELLTLCRPYAAASTRDELRRVVRVEPLRPEAYNSSIPRDLSAIVLRCLEKDPARRYQTTAELAADLRAFLAYQPVKARHVTPVGRAARWIRREPLRASLLLTLILALLGALGTWSYLAGKQRYIERGEAVERAEQIELALAAGFRRVMSGSRISAAVADFGGVLTLDSGNTAAVVGLILTLIRTNNHARAATELATAQQRFVAAPVFDRLDAYLQAARGGRLYHRDWRAAQPEPGTVLDCFLSGIFEYEYAVYAADRSAGRRAYGLLDRACLMSPVRRRYLLCARAETSSYHSDHEIARDAARVLEALWPTAEDARYSRALALAEVDPDAAIRLFTELSATDPTGYAYRDHGELLMRRGDFDGAVESFRAALALGPESADFLSSMAEALRKQGKPDLALVQIERAVAAMPGRPVLHFNLGVVLRDLGRSREAVAAFATAARLTPQDHLPHNEISRLQADLGDLPAAIQARRAAVDAAPDDLVLAYRNDLAVLLIRAGQHGQAERVFADLLRQTPDDRDLRRNYGICLVDLGRKQEGFAELRRCIEEHPKWPEAYLALGGLLMLEGEVVEATRLISRGMTLRAGQRPAPKPR